MKGSPIIRAIFMILPLLFLAWPLATVTASHGYSPIAKTAASQLEKHSYRADLSLKATHPFTKIIFTAGDQRVVWENGDGDKELTLPITSGELLCGLDVTWKGRPARAALSLKIVANFLAEKEITFWTQDEERATHTQLLQWPGATEGGADE